MHPRFIKKRKRRTKKKFKVGTAQAIAETTSKTSKPRSLSKKKKKPFVSAYDAAILKKKAFDKAFKTAEKKKGKYLSTHDVKKLGRNQY